MQSIRQLLTQYLVKCNKMEILSEKIRQNISQNPYFEIKTVFQRFDKFHKGYLIPSDFSEFMLQNQLYPTESELYLIFRDFDKERLGLVNIDKFQSQILPKENRKLKKDILKRQPYGIQGRLPLDLEFLIAKYMDDKIKNIKELNTLRDKMSQVKAYSTQEAYTLIDEQKLGCISNIKQIDSFLRKNGKALSTEELGRIYRYLSFQTNAQITYEMFREHLNPFGLGLYQGYAQQESKKEALQNCYIEKKLYVERERAENIHRQVEIQHAISNLKESNQRLHHILSEQDAELSLSRRLRYPYY